MRDRPTVVGNPFAQKPKVGEGAPKTLQTILGAALNTKVAQT